MIEFRQVKKAFGAKQVLDGLTFEVGPAEVVFLLGRSGVGKSVTLRHIVGLVQPDSGEVYLEGQRISFLPESAYFEVRRKCGMVFQFPALFDSLTVYENIVFGLKSHQIGTPEQWDEQVRQNLERVRVPADVLDKYPSELSFGMQKRVSLARTLAVRPKYLLFDEPTTGLDPMMAHWIHSLIRDLCTQLKLAALIVSHDMAGALRFGDRILILHEGRVEDQGNPSQIRASRKPLTQEFLRDSTGSF